MWSRFPPLNGGHKKKVWKHCPHHHNNCTAPQPHPLPGQSRPCVPHPPISRSSKWALSFRFPQPEPYMPHTSSSHATWLYYLHNIWRTVQIMMPLVMQFSPVFSHLGPNIFLNTYSWTPSACISFLTCQTKIHTHIKNKLPQFPHLTCSLW